MNIKEHHIENGVRYYDVDGDLYPSVTSILSATKDTSFLEQWRERVGKEEADRITNESARIGNITHTMIEHHLKSNDHLIDKIVEDEEYIDKANKIFQKMKVYTKYITPEYQEFPLASKNLRVAGRVDCIGTYKGELSIIDFKTSRREKVVDHIHDYFIQTTLYALMAYETLNIQVRQGVIIIGNYDTFPNKYTRPLGMFIREAVDRVRLYHQILEKGKNA